MVTRSAEKGVPHLDKDHLERDMIYGRDCER